MKWNPLPQKRLSAQQAFLCLVAITASGCAEAATPVPSPSLAPQRQECEEFRQALNQDAPGLWTQGWVTVPEAWSKPNSKQIRVFYYARLIRDSQGQIAKPTVFFNGGPGFDSHSSYDTIEPLEAPQSLSMIYIDQRGTGCSDPYP